MFMNVVQDVVLHHSLFQIPRTAGIIAARTFTFFLAGLARTKQTARKRKRKHIPPESPEEQPEPQPVNLSISPKLTIDLTGMSGSGSDDDQEAEKDGINSLLQGAHSTSDTIMIVVEEGEETEVEKRRVFPTTPVYVPPKVI